MEKLKDIRLYHGLTQREVASILGVSRSTYSGWENDIDTIPLIRLNDFCNLFNVSLDYVCGLSTNNSNGFKKIKLDRKTIGSHLKEVRTNHSDTQEFIAKLLNTDRSNYSRYESGERMILTSFLVYFARHYHTSMDYLCGKDNQK